ncbi:hypothetical protein [Brevibacterium luteolum]|uniref:Uncharacterized protein n=1 Tax=Brevibacterium luteolum TaxID=199591 RepID=A0A6G8KYT0_9MICO|nr:hypothetical protein [Brevibacterium luteolum]QIN29952.1 hypothetical protein EW640_12215 [Brevibacterium luteolum]
MSFYPQGHGPYRRRRGMNGCGCAIVMLGIAFIFAITIAVIVFITAMTHDGSSGTGPRTPAPSSTGDDWQPSGG